jgi:peptide/nickel transport system substrate-binding protein
MAGDFGRFWRRSVTRRAFMRGGAAAGLATGVFTLGGCSTSSSGGAAATTAPAAATTAPTAAGTAAAAAGAPSPVAKLGGAIRTGFSGDGPNMDIHSNITQGVLTYGAGICYSKLVKFRTDVKPGQFAPTGDLAESWDQPDDLTWVFKLRRDAKFHNIPPVNGRAATAEDVKFSFERELALKINAGRMPSFAKMEVVDPQTIRLVTTKPDADFLLGISYYANKIVPKESVDVKGDLREGPIIGTGPWIHENWEPGKVYSAKKNPDYFVKGLPRADRIDIFRITDTALLQSAFRAKDLDVLNVSVTSTEADALQKGNPGETVVEKYKVPQGIQMRLNASKAPFSDQRFRQAIFKAIDKQAIIDTIFGGQGWYFPAIAMPAEDWYLPEDEAKQIYKQDLEGARQLLAQVGGPPSTDFEILALPFGTTYSNSAELVQQDLKKIGITSHIKLPADNTAFSNAVLTEGTYDIGITADVPITPNIDLVRNHYSTGTGNAGRVKDPQFDALIDRQSGLVKDPEGRKKIMLDLQRMILTQAQTVHLAGDVASAIRYKYVQGFFFVRAVDEVWAPVWLDK